MGKFFLLEVSTFLLFIISIPLIQVFNLMSFGVLVNLYLIGLIFLITVVFPAAILLEFTQKYAPETMPSKALKSNHPKRKDHEINLIFMVLSFILGWGTFLIASSIIQSVLVALLLSYLLVSILFGAFLVKFAPDRKGTKQKPVFIAFGLSAILVITMIALFEIISYIPVIFTL